MTAQGPTLDEELAAFVSETVVDDVPEEAVRAVERAFVDTVGVTLSGIAEPVGEKARTVFAASDKTSGENRVLGTTDRASTGDAALVMATAGHALDYDDVTGSAWHPSVTLVAPSLAVGERVGATGADLITAFAVGFEVEWTVSKCVLPAHYERGWHATATFGSFGAAATTSSLLGLDEEATRHALNIAASTPSGLKKNFGTMTKPLHAGLAARSGVTAALLAAEGFTAAETALGGNRGFCDLYSGDEPPSMDEWTRPGDPWALLAEGISVKKFPCCYFTHSAIAATQRLADDHDLPPEDIDEIAVIASQGAADALHYEDPDTGLEAKFSMEYTVASAVVRDRVDLDAFVDEAVDDYGVQAVRERVAFDVDSSLDSDSFQTAVEITTDDGKKHRHVQEVLPGSPDRPLSDAELRAKYDDATVHAPAGIPTDKAYDLLDRLRDVDDVETLVVALCPP